MQPSRWTRAALGVWLAAALLVPGASATAAGHAGLGTSTTARHGSQALPPGWTIRTDDGAAELVWRSRRPIPLSDARIEFWSGERLLGTPKPAADGRTFSLPLSAPLARPHPTLRVTLGGRPLDRVGGRVLSRSVGSSGNLPRQKTRPSDLDPGIPGPFRTRTQEYKLPGLEVTGLPLPAEVQGVVVRPRAAPGPRPLVLFLHGRHSTCYRGGPDGRSSGRWPCPQKWRPIPSYRGYLETQQLLASQGYVTVSISANAINGQDYLVPDGGAQARSELVRHHLDLFSRWTTSGGAPFGSALVGAVDPQRVMLVGHSRGGEGVNRAAVDAVRADPWRIDSQLLIGPTAFGQQTAPGVDTAVLLPFCDGDVSDLQGQAYIDEAHRLTTPLGDPALRSAVMVMGANHNFFNSEWTPGVAAAPAWDDWGSRRGVCGSRTPGRLSATEQRTVGAVYAASAARAFIKDDPRALALLDGSNVRPPSIGGATTLVTAIGANRTPVVSFRPSTSLRVVDATASVCRAYRVAKDQVTCAPHLYPWTQPHFLRMFAAADAPPSTALRMGWRAPGAKVRVSLPQPVDLSRSISLELRVAVNPLAEKARLGVLIGDGEGNVARLGSRLLTALPGDQNLSRLWAQPLRVPLPEESEVALADIRFVRLVGESRSGRVVVLDAHGRAPGTSTNPIPRLPRVNVLDASVREGDGEANRGTVTLEIAGRVLGGERLYVEANDLQTGGASESHMVRLQPGQSRVDIDFPVVGDTRDDYARQIYFGAKALSGVATDDYVGLLTIRDDDPAPTVLIDDATTTVTEGSELVWRVRLSEPSDKYINLVVTPVPAGQSELTVSDLPKRFRRQHDLRLVPDETRLSDTHLRFDATFGPGRRGSKWVLPVGADDVIEGTESVTLQQKRRNRPPMPSRLHGSVTDVSGSPG